MARNSLPGRSWITGSVVKEEKRKKSKEEKKSEEDEECQNGRQVAKDNTVAARGPGRAQLAAAWRRWPRMSWACRPAGSPSRHCGVPCCRQPCFDLETQLAVTLALWRRYRVVSRLLMLLARVLCSQLLPNFVFTYYHLILPLVASLVRAPQQRRTRQQSSCDSGGDGRCAAGRNAASLGRCRGRTGELCVRAGDGCSAAEHSCLCRPRQIPKHGRRKVEKGGKKRKKHVCCTLTLLFLFFLLPPSFFFLFSSPPPLN